VKNIKGMHQHCRNSLWLFARKRITKREYNSTQLEKKIFWVFPPLISVIVQLQPGSVKLERIFRGVYYQYQIVTNKFYPHSFMNFM